MNKEVKRQYEYLRKKTILTTSRFNIFELPEGEETLDVISEIVSGRVYMIEPYKALNSTILNEKGKVVGIVYVMMFEDKYWILTSQGNEESKRIILDKFESLGINDITNNKTVVSVEGPHSWEILKEVVGLEIVGLSYLNFMECELGEVSAVISRSGVTGEYGYKFFIDKEQEGTIKDKIKKIDFVEILEIEDEDENFKQVMRLAISEVRFPVYGCTIRQGESPVENEIRWMIDWEREGFTGKNAVDEEKTGYRYRVVGIMCDQPEGVFDSSNIEGKAKIFIEDEEIGFIKSFVYSFTLKKYIGYAYLEKEWGYAGIDEYILNVEGEQYPIETSSTPFFLTESSQITME